MHHFYNLSNASASSSSSSSAASASSFPSASLAADLAVLFPNGVTNAAVGVGKGKAAGASSSAGSSAAKDGAESDDEDKEKRDEEAGGAAAAASAASATAEPEKKETKKKKGAGKGGRKGKSRRGKAAAAAAAAASTSSAPNGGDDMTDEVEESKDEDADAEDPDAPATTTPSGKPLPTMGVAVTAGAGRGRKGARTNRKPRSKPVKTEAAATASAASSSAAASAQDVSKHAVGASGAGKAGVKPARIQMEAWALEEKLNPVRRHERPSRLFFGNTAYYVLFRLHQVLTHAFVTYVWSMLMRCVLIWSVGCVRLQFLYHRLLTAKELSLKQRVVSTMTAAGRKYPVTPEARLELWHTKLYELLDARVEQSKFEDELRALMGASAYILFTIDKLIAQLIKQVPALHVHASCPYLPALPFVSSYLCLCVAAWCQAHLIVTTPACLQLLRLYHYEHARARGDVTLSSLTLAGANGPAPLPPAQPMTLERSAQFARMYQSHCANFITENETCAQIEFVST